jgi:hypothetical protein
MPGYAVPPFAVPPYGRNPNSLGGELTPYPRRFGEVLAAIFQLFGKHLVQWLALGLLVGVIPGVLSGAFQLLLSDVQGPDMLMGLPLGGGGQSGSCTLTFYLPPTSVLVRDAGLIIGVLALSAVFGALEASALGVAAHEALLGRRVGVTASLTRGLRRLPATLGTTVLIGVLIFLLLAPGVATFEVALYHLSGLNLCDTNAVLSDRVVLGLLLNVVGLVLFVPGLVLALIVGIRLGPAPYVAATEMVRPGQAIRRSWGLTRGFFWRTLGIVLVMSLITALLGVPFAQLDPALANLALVPLTQVLASPLLALTWMVLLYDMRLRREGYGALRQEREQAGPPPPMG